MLKSYRQVRQVKLNVYTLQLQIHRLLQASRQLNTSRIHFKAPGTKTTQIPHGPFYYCSYTRPLVPGNFDLMAQYGKHQIRLPLRLFLLA